MNPFDLGAEVFIVPTLWAILGATVLGFMKSAIKRNKEVATDEETGAIVGVNSSWDINKPRLIKTGAAALLGALVLSSLVVVPPGHRGAIYTTSGVSTVERNEGYSFMAPLIHNANMVNVREQVFETINEDDEATLFAQTRDVLEVPVRLGVNYMISPDMAADIFKNVGQGYEAAIIKPAVFDVATQEIGKIDAVDFPREREALAQAIQAELARRLGPVGITVTFVAVQDTVFPSEFTSAVLAKEVADEKAIESERLVTVAQNEAAQVERRADGEAYAIDQVQKSLIESPEYLEYLRLQKWDGILPATLLGDSSDVILNLP